MYACDDATVGYLDCANAKYSKDSLEIVRFSNLTTEIEGLKTTLNALYSNEELAGLFRQVESLNAQLKELEAKMEEMYDQAYELMEEMDIDVYKRQVYSFAIKLDLRCANTKGLEIVIKFLFKNSTNV